MVNGHPFGAALSPAAVSPSVGRDLRGGLAAAEAPGEPCGRSAPDHGRCGAAPTIGHSLGRCGSWFCRGACRSWKGPAAAVAAGRLPPSASRGAAGFCRGSSGPQGSLPATLCSPGRAAGVGPGCDGRVAPGWAGRSEGWQAGHGQEAAGSCRRPQPLMRLKSARTLAWLRSSASSASRLRRTAGSSSITSTLRSPSKNAARVEALSCRAVASSA